MRDVRPILQKHCYPCHGAEKQKSNLRLDIKSECAQGGETYGPSFVTGNADESPLIRFGARRRSRAADATGRKTSDGGRNFNADKVGRAKSHLARTPAYLVQLDDKRDHWSFKPLMRPDPPAILDSEAGGMTSTTSS